MPNPVVAPMSAAPTNGSSRSMSAYRTFRARLIASETVQRRIDKTRVEASPWAHRPLPQQGLAYGRHVIRAFRAQAHEVLESTVAHEMHERVPEAAHARRALRLPDDVSLHLKRPIRVAYFVLGMFGRPAWWRSVAARLRQIGTPEGRQWVFRNYARTLGLNRPSYGDGLDFLLRHFALPRSGQVFDDIARLDVRTVRNGWLLGLRTGEALKQFRDAWRGFSAEKLAVFAELGVIRTQEELALLEPWRGERHNSSITPAAHAQARRSIARLLALGVPRASTIQLLAFWHRCAPEDLDRSLRALAARGYSDSPRLFEMLGETLWRARKARNWDFVIDVVRAREIRQIALFNQFLESDTLPGTAIVHALQAHGATLDELAQVQSFVLTLSDRREDPTRVITLLLAAPHALRVGQLANCRSYASCRPEDELEQFLAVLAQHGFGTEEGVLAFHDIYRSWITTRNVGRLLALYRGLRDAPPDPQAAAAWVADIGEKYLDSLEYLAKALRAPDRAAFQEIRPFARIAKGVLVWAVEGHGHATVEALRVWRRTAGGVEQVKDHDWHDPVIRILLDDAAARGDFAHVNRNMSAFWRALWDERDAIVGRPQVGADKTEFDAYWARAREVEPHLRQRVLPQLRHQLDATGGLLAKSLVRAAWHDTRAYAQELATFNAEVTALLGGDGPAAVGLTELQADAISAVYGIDVETGNTYWAKVAGLERHLSGLTLRPYTMRFEHQRIAMRRPIDRQGLTALLDAIAYGRSFRDALSVDIGRAWERLSPKQMREDEPSVSPQTLHRHLGVLLGTLPEAMSEALGTEVDALGLDTHEPARRHQAANRIRDLFGVELGDALPQAAAALEARLGESAADALARRLIGVPAQELKPAERLEVSLAQTARRVSDVYGRWIHRQLDAFTGAASAEGACEYRAIVSKHGAAYFAKVATKLCSGDNERMWHERRQSHLLVFDVGGRRLVAMAMLYYERITAIDTTRPTLVMRAINTVAEADTGHDAESIVRAFLSVGEQIAQENKLAAFAVPDNTEQHLLSNRNDIVESIEARCDGLPTRYSRRYDHPLGEIAAPYAVSLRSDGLFYGYEHGRAPVDTLYVLWAPPHESTAHTARDDANAPRPTTTRNLEWS